MFVILYPPGGDTLLIASEGPGSRITTGTGAPLTTVGTGVVVATAPPVTAAEAFVTTVGTGAPLTTVGTWMVVTIVVLINRPS